MGGRHWARAVRIPTLDGAVEMKIPPGIGSGKKLRIKGRGLGSGARKGDQYVRIMIQVPERLSEAERELMEKLRDTVRFQAENVLRGGHDHQEDYRK